jgi:hypothetical protein
MKDLRRTVMFVENNVKFSVFYQLMLLIFLTEMN